MEPASPLELRSSIGGTTKAQYTFYITENNIFVINRSQPEFALLINRKQFASSFIPVSELSKHKLEKPLSIFAIFGIIEISEVRFLVAVSRAQTVCQIGQAEIMKIESVKFLTISRDQYVNFDYESCYDRLERIKEFLKVGFYFSYNYKLHANFTGKMWFTPQECSQDFGRSHFIWNYKAIKDFLPSKSKSGRQNSTDASTNIDLLGLNSHSVSGKSSEQGRVFTPAEVFASSFFVPFIQGYVGKIEEEDTRLVLLSRRSYLMGGTRYNDRGVDATGHVANYVETEQLVFVKQRVYRFFQIRGSLPFYWEQVKGLINPAVEIHQRLDINQEVMGKHINLVTNNGKFKKLIILNLLSRRKSEEETLSLYLVSLLENLNRVDQFKNRVLYEHIDFHAITKPTDFSPVDKFVYNIIDSGFNGSEVGYDEYEWSDLLETYTQKQAQQALVRTNCLDCLDRTNAMQTKLGHYSLFRILSRAGSRLAVMITTEENRNPLPFFEKAGVSFYEQVRKIWANNGDQISMIYAGTGATTSSVTRKGEKSTFTSFFDHKLKTVRRFYLNTFDDNFKQEIIDVLLHKKNQTIRQSTLYHSQTDVGRLEEVTLYVITMLSVGGNGNLTLTPQTIDRIFKDRSPKDLILIITRNDKEKQVEMTTPDMPLVCSTFLEFFFLVVKPPNPFKLIEEFTDGKFHMLLFAHKDEIQRVTFSKSDKINASNMFQSTGLRTSLIVEHTGIEIFCIKADKSAFNYSAGKTIEKVFEKYIDKEYDLVLFVGHVEGYEQEKVSVNPKFQKLCEEPKPDSCSRKYTNLVMAFGSKELMAHGFQPEVSRVVVEDSAVTPQLTFNSFKFHIKRVG